MASANAFSSRVSLMVGSVSDKAARLRAAAQTVCGLLYWETFIGASLKSRNGIEEAEAEKKPDPYKRGRVDVGGHQLLKM